MHAVAFASSTAGWQARAFGSGADDVAVVFDAAEPGSATTAVLAACLSDGDGRALQHEEAWDWTLNRRLHGLIAVRLAAGDASLELQAPCGACGEPMALPLDVASLGSEPAAPRFAWRDAQGVEFRLRLPCGRDLRQWRDRASLSPMALARTLVEAIDDRSVEEGVPWSADALPALDDAFEAHDPLTALRLQAGCPSCGQVNDVACDLEAALLAGFAGRQAVLLDEVARLAGAFHWSEAEILALPRWRRAQYLRRIDGAGSWA
ncbi:hypothetical protein [Rhizobacter sp. OV335]|uniref:hypothetical protein n=1 Tax=Rhizobacter sp. OV335 TaxID=1500264 RepID=UPI0009197B23|nr:hypothetical protein [Rhizobacter sp. OV335]SHN09056.1 hypothetical protein SAMN02787076_03257 [Rhizobacter sp. OV335]